ncbi:MAG: hypothetical protein ACPGXZ_10225 [Saprospiraceae bacterium]
MKKLFFAFALTLGMFSFSSLNAEAPVEEKPDWVLIRGIEGELILLDDGCNSTVQVMTENSDGSFTTVNYGGGPC